MEKTLCPHGWSLPQSWPPGVSKSINVLVKLGEVNVIGEQVATMSLDRSDLQNLELFQARVCADEEFVPHLVSVK